MKKYLKSIILTTLLSVCACSVLACGPNNSGDGAEYLQKPPVIRCELGVRIKDENGIEAHRTSWEMVEQDPSIVQHYTVTLEANKKYIFEGIYIDEMGWMAELHGDDFQRMSNSEWGEPAGESIYRIFNTTIDYDEDKIEINKESNGGYPYDFMKNNAYAFEFIGLQVGECTVALNVEENSRLYNVTTKKIEEDTANIDYNITFIFE